MVKLDRICREANVMLIFARSYGLTGFVRISLKVILCVYQKISIFSFSKACIRLKLIPFKKTQTDWVLTEVKYRNDAHFI